MVRNLGFLRRAFRLSSFGLAVAGAIGPAFLFLITLAVELPNFVNPCMEWGTQAGVHRFNPDSPCRGRMSGTSETRFGAATRLVIVQGGMLAACCAALVGAYRYRLRLSVLAFAFMFLITVPMAAGFPILTLISAVCFGGSAALVASHVRRTSGRNH